MERLLQKVYKFFDIRKGELSISIWMQLYLFLIICALLIVKPTVNALFLSELGADALAIAFLITAFVAVLVSYSYNKLIERYPLRYVIRGTLLLFAILFIGMGVTVETGLTSVFLSYTFYMLVGLFALLATSQFWVMANVVFNVREAKRLFGFIGSGGIAGGIVGGYFTSLFANNLGNGVLIIIAGSLIIGCAFVFQTIWKNRVQTLKKKKRKERSTVSDESSISLILKSKHLTYLAAVIGLGVLVAKLVDYQFSFIASEAIEDPRELASFFGFWFSTFNIVSLLVQLFLTRKILERADIGVGLATLPLGVILCCSIIIFIPELWVVIILKGLDGSLKQSLHKSSVELLSLPIPSDVKNKTKTFIDVVVDSLATGIAGIFLIFIIKGLQLPATYISILTAVLVLFWIYMVLKVRSTYLSTFRQSIVNRENLKSNKKSVRQIRKNLNLIFKTGSDKDVINGLKRVKDVAHPSLKQSMLELLQHPNDIIKAGAVRNLPLVTKEPIPEVQDLIHIKNDDVVAAALDYLLTQDHISHQFFEQYLDHEDEYIATAALLVLANEAQENSRLTEQYNLELRVRLFVDEMKSDSSQLRLPELVKLIEILGYIDNPKYHVWITHFLKHQNPILREAAILAAGHTEREMFLPDLLDYLNEARFRESVIKSLSNYGNKVIASLEKVYTNTNLTTEVKRSIPLILASIKTKEAFKMMLRIATKGNFITRTKTTELLHEWRKENKSFKIKTTTLKKALLEEIDLQRTLLDNYFSLKIIERSKLNPNKVISLPEKTSRSQLIQEVKLAMDHGLQRIFNLLSLHYDPDDVYIAYSGLISERKESKLNALEYLDGLLGNDLKSLLFPLIESGTINYDLETEDYQSKVDLKDQKDCLKSLSGLNHAEIIIKVIDLLRFIKESYALKLLISFKNSENNKISEQASAAIEFKENRSQTA